MSVSGKSLDDLIEKKDTERGRLLSRWIGLLPIEEKDIIAREKYNTEVKPFLLSNRYNTESLTQEIQAFEVDIKTLKSEITKYKKENKVLDDEIKTLEKTKETLLASKKVIDENVLKIDITTLKRKMDDCITNGKNKKAELELIEKELKEIGDVDFSVEQYDKSVHELSSLKEKRGELLANHKSVSHNIEHLKNSEICPVCKRKLDNVDNTAQIKEQEKELEWYRNPPNADDDGYPTDESTNPDSTSTSITQYDYDYYDTAKKQPRTMAVWKWEKTSE
jgi:DNA repair exonuclease SbcCD ATPase subunit